MPSLSPTETAPEDESLQSLSTRDTSEEYTEDDDDIEDDEYEFAQTGDDDDDEDEDEQGNDEVEYLGTMFQNARDERPSRFD